MYQKYHFASAEHFYAVIPTCKEHNNRINNAWNRENLSILMSVFSGSLAVLGIIASLKSQVECIACTLLMVLISIIMIIIWSNSRRELLPYQETVKSKWGSINGHYERDYSSM